MKIAQTSAGPASLTILDLSPSPLFALVMNHPFVDGNKRIGHAAMETFLVLNGYEIVASTDVQKRVMLDLAAGRLGRAEFTEWLRAHLAERQTT